MAEKLGSIAFFIGSRANYGRLKPVMTLARRHFDVKIILAASGLWEKIVADEYVSCLVDGDTTREMALTSGLLHIQIVSILDRLKPDLVFVHGDRYEVLNVAQVAAYMNIPIAHTEGGEFTGTIDDKVRYAISSLADIHFPVTIESAKNLLFARNSNIHIVGSTALDNLKGYKRKVSDYVVVLFHPNTTDPEPVEPLINAMTRLVELGTIVRWVNPNVDAGSKQMLKKIHKRFQLTKGLSPEEYYKLIANCSVLVGNTSSGIKEGAYLGVPYVCVGNRQLGREHADNVLFSDNETEKILGATFAQLNAKVETSTLFGDGNTAGRIIDVLKEGI